MNKLLLIISFLFPCLIIAFSEKFLLSCLKKIGFEQKIRKEGPASHQAKNNTLTAGGLIFFSALIFCPFFSFIYNSFNANKTDFNFLFTFCLITAFSGLIGFLDDYLKKVKNQNEGLKPKQKLLLQIFTSIILAFLLSRSSTVFFGQEITLFKPIFYIFIFCVLAGIVNAVNFTDGLDGLGSSVSAWSFLGLIILVCSSLALIKNNTETIICSLVMAGICCGFWWINKHPAKVFMGDTGSFFLGGALGTLALLSKTEWYLFLIAFIPVIELLSVVLQVISSKFSRKYLKRDIRPFLMTPFHHHLELKGWSENLIVHFLASIQALISFFLLILII